MSVVVLVERLIKPLPFFVYVAIVLLGGSLFASYGAWKDEHDSRLAADRTASSLETENAALNKPIITGEIRQMFAGQNSDGAVVQIVEVYVENSGAATILKDWGMAIHNASINLSATNCIMPEELPVITPIGLKGHINRAHMLQELTIDRRIERGGGQTGWLIFTFPAYDLALVTPGTVIAVGCIDAFGNQHVIEKTLKKGSELLTPAEALLYSPGSEQLFDMPSPAASPTPNAKHRALHRP